MRKEKNIHGILFCRHRQQPACGQEFFRRARQHPPGDAGAQHQFSDDAIGIVCPVYAGEPPKLVKQFLRESSFQADYFYFILTYGFDATDAPEYTARLAAEAGIHVDYIASIQMVDNYLPVFDMAEQMGMDKHVEEQLTAAVQAVSQRERGIPEATEEGRKLHAQVAAMNRELPAFNDGSQITVLEGCIGCGVCQLVCPVGNLPERPGSDPGGGQSQAEAG